MNQRAMKLLLVGHLFLSLLAVAVTTASTATTVAASTRSRKKPQSKWLWTRPSAGTDPATETEVPDATSPLQTPATANETTSEESPSPAAPNDTASSSSESSTSAKSTRSWLPKVWKPKRSKEATEQPPVDDIEQDAAKPTDSTTTTSLDESHSLQSTSLEEDEDEEDKDEEEEDEEDEDEGETLEEKESPAARTGWRLPFMGPKRAKATVESKAIDDVEVASENATTGSSSTTGTSDDTAVTSINPNSNNTSTGDDKTSATSNISAADVGNSPSSSNVTDPEQQRAQKPQQQSQGLIVYGPPPAFSGRSTGAPLNAFPRQLSQLPPGQYQQRQLQQMQQQQLGNNANSVVMVDLLSSLASMAIRIWFLSWLTRRMQTQEESIHPSQHFCWEGLNDRFSRDAAALRSALSEPPRGIHAKTWQRHVRKVRSGSRSSSKSKRLSNQDLAALYSRTVVVVNLHTGGGGGGSGSDSSSIDLESMPDVVSFILQQQLSHAFGTCLETDRPMELEVVFCVDSPGGAVTTYGLAAAQLRRLNSNLPHSVNITTTVCVDEYAASGGYMIASQADQIVAAPFSIVGSVGVIKEGLNYYELAKRYGIQPMIVKAGESKNPLSQWGPVTRQDLEQEQRRLVKVHDEFKALVLRGRPGMAPHMDQVTDGSIFLGREAKDLGMVDQVMTTDEYILQRIEAGDRVLKLHRTQQGRNPMQLRLSPLDILPHLRTWILQTVLPKLQNNDVLLGLVRTGTWIGFFNHIFRAYCSSRR